MSVGDPWLKKYVETETIGRSLFLVHSKRGADFINSLVFQKIISVEKVDYRLFEESQWPTVVRKSNTEKEKLFYNLQMRLLAVKWYSNWANKSLKNMKKHRQLMLYVLHPYCQSKSMEKKDILFKLFKKLFNKIKRGG